jgi:hypothetical protein
MNARAMSANAGMHNLPKRLLVESHSRVIVHG